MSKPESKPGSVKSGKDDLAAQWLAKLRNKPIVAGLIVAGTIITALGGFWTTLPDGLKTAVFPFIYRPLVLPGETGWIFVGYYRQDNLVFIEGPYVEVINSNFRGRSRYVEIGDTIRVKGARRVFMVDFKSLGATKKLTSPIEHGAISANDETGVTLPSGTELIVRDVSAGAWPGNPNAALWARIVLAKRDNAP